MQLLFAVFDDDALAQTGELVELLGHRLVFHEITNRIVPFTSAMIGLEYGSQLKIT
jgi:hypothetical protein